MSDATREFCAENSPFRVHHLHLGCVGREWVVRDRTGYDIADCDDEDSARAIVEALNEVKGKP